MVILDRSGRRVHVSSNWKKAERESPAIAKGLSQTTAKDNSRATIGRFVLVAERLPDDFSLAPNGWLCQLVSPSSMIAGESEIAVAEAALLKLSRREFDVLRSVLAGTLTGVIAQRMNISKGTVKNHTLSIYRKLGVKSQRALFAMFAPIRTRFIEGR